MQDYKRKRSFTLWGGFTVLCAAVELGIAAAACASAAPTQTLLHSFAGGTSDGAEPEAGLIADASGNLYGTTALGGTSNDGTVFNLSGTGFVTTCQRGLRRRPC